MTGARRAKGSAGETVVGQPNDLDPAATKRRTAVVFGVAAVAIVGFFVGVQPGGSSRHVVSRSLPVGISCPQAGYCMAVDDQGTAQRYTEGNWSKPQKIDTGPLNNVACTSRAFCVAVGATGDAEVYNGRSWSKPRKVDIHSAYRRALFSGPSGLGVVSCSSSAFCVAGDSLGHALVFTGHRWSEPQLIESRAATQKAQLYGTADMSALSCPLPTFCAAVTVSGRPSVYDGRSWTTRPTLEDNVAELVAQHDALPVVTSVSCPTAEFCVAVDPIGDAVVYDGSSWSDPVTIDSASAATGSRNGLSSVSCSSPQFCMAVDGHGSAVAFNGTSWAAPVSIDASLGLAKVSCAGPEFCGALDDLGSVLFYDGAHWTKPIPFDQGT